MKEKIQHPKIVVLGSGSLFFGRQSIWQMITSKHLNKGTLALVDTDLERCEKMGRLARMVVEHEKVPLKIEASTDRRAVLEGADFVILSFADRSVKFRGIDCQTALKYGIRMCSGDTIGPGGIMRTLRELPEILNCARDIEEICPDVWVINYINPTAANGIGLMRYAPRLKTFALCDGLHMPHIKIGYACRAGVIRDKSEWTPEVDTAFDMRIAGVNHFTFMLKAEYKGKDVMPDLAESTRQKAIKDTDGGDEGAKSAYNASIGYALYEAYGRFPTCVAHTKEYVRFWQGLGKTKEPIPPLSIWETEARYVRHAEMWAQVDGFITGKQPIAEYITAFSSDHATDVIENMVGSLGKAFFVNTRNNGAVPNMAEDAFLELMCDVTMDGPVPRPVCDMPRGLRGMQEQVLDAHELAAEAAVTCDRETLKRAFITDPLVSSLADSDRMIEELLVAEADALPEGWR